MARPGEGESFRRSEERGPNDVEDDRHMPLDHEGLDAKDTKAGARKPRVTRCVPRLIVVRTVDLDDEPVREAREVYDEPADGMLAAKVSAKAVAAKPRPEHGLARSSRVMAHGVRAMKENGVERRSFAVGHA